VVAPPTGSKGRGPDRLRGTINCDKFFGNRLKGFDSAGDRILAFSIDYKAVAVNTVLMKY